MTNSIERSARRLMTVLSADVVGYSRHMAADENRTVQAIGALRSRVAAGVLEFAGRLVDFTGDNFLAEFPTPLDGLRFALQILGEPVPLQLRIGLHVGEVRAEDGLLFGDTVNVAARIQAFAEPGAVCITRSVLDLVQERIGLRIENLGTPHLKNLPQRVEVFQVALAAPREARLRGVEQHGLRRIAVLPFDMLTRGEGDEFLADGLTEDLVALLSRVPGFYVIARSSTFAFKGRTQDVHRAAEELGVRYVVTGSVRRSGTRMRISAQLNDADSGAQLWAERFDRVVDDLFNVLDEVAHGIAAQLVPELTQAEAVRAANAPPETLDAWSFYQRALFERLSPTTRQGLDEAEALLQQSLASDDAFAPAISFLANVVATRYLFGWSNAGKSDRPRALALARRAIELAPNHPSVLHDCGVVHAVLGDVADGEAMLLRAVQENPNNAHSWAILGYIAIRRGNVSEGIERVNRAIDLSPRDPRLHLWDNYLATAYLTERRWSETLVHAERATHAFEGFDAPWVFRCAALVQLERMREARAAVWRFREMHPDANRTSIADLLRRVGPSDATLRSEIIDTFVALLESTTEAPEPTSYAAPGSQA